jgi:DNA-binding response OmpR family regulator
MRILVVEDDRDVADFVCRGLEEEGNSVQVVHDGGAALQQALAHTFDIIVLDVMLPFLDGFEVTRRLRSHRNQTPVLLLTARDSPKDVVRGLDAGADDYLAKPFSFDVLLARIRARTRGPSTEHGKRLQVADLALDPESHEVWRAGVAIALTRTEFAILECLMSAAGRVVTRQALIDTVWGLDRDIENNTLDVFMRFLRAKVDHGDGSRLIQTLRGVGYSVREQQL